MSLSSLIERTLPPYLFTGCRSEVSDVLDCSRSFRPLDLVEVNDSMIDACLRAASRSLGF